MFHRLSREERTDRANLLCDAAGCDDLQRARHVRLFVDDFWDVHPPKEFVKWLNEPVPGRNFQGQDGMSVRHGLHAVSAWNADHWRQEYFKAVGTGEAEAPREQDEMAL